MTSRLTLIAFVCLLASCATSDVPAATQVEVAPDESWVFVDVESGMAGSASGSIMLMANDEGHEWVGVYHGEPADHYRVDRRDLTEEQIALFDDLYGQDDIEVTIHWDESGHVTSVTSRTH